MVSETTAAETTMTTSTTNTTTKYNNNSESNIKTKTLQDELLGVSARSTKCICTSFGHKACGKSPNIFFKSIS